jgi:hypothetical protein
MMNQAEFEQHVGAGNISPSIADALARASAVYQEMDPPCLAGFGQGEHRALETR